MNERENRRQTRCSFCGKDQSQVRKLVAGPGVYICDQFIPLCREVLEEDAKPAAQRRTKGGLIPNPKIICAGLDQYVVGQDQVRKLVAGPGVYICDLCIDLCQEVLEEDNRSGTSKKTKTGFIPNPKTIS